MKKLPFILGMMMIVSCSKKEILNSVEIKAEKPKVQYNLELDEPLDFIKKKTK